MAESGSTQVIHIQQISSGTNLDWKEVPEVLWWTVAWAAFPPCTAVTMPAQSESRGCHSPAHIQSHLQAATCPHGELQPCTHTTAAPYRCLAFLVHIWDKNELKQQHPSTNTSVDCNDIVGWVPKEVDFHQLSPFTLSLGQGCWH